ncbi:hypothetical protein BT63DRAFT_412279 [Microthyrium microscopicum]|uniref:Uncharacterized protein n=1 Tax=Microthyrium microscopicum TaxID=703497 RepID=A0A6A6UID8_9PEZI|nr:hypothetical protein BT63DRAFT_412279 [Microthyrium microscopicum]
MVANGRTWAKIPVVRCPGLLSLVHSLVGRTLRPIPDFKGVNSKTFEDMRLAFPYAARFACQGRTLFITDTDYLGLGPRGLRKNDSVAIFQSGRIPFVVEEANEMGDLRILGECYVAGVMSGELEHEISEGRYRVESLSII